MPAPSDTTSPPSAGLPPDPEPATAVRSAVAGTVLAAGALIAALIVVGMVAVLALLDSGHERLEVGSGSLTVFLVAGGLACVNAALLIALALNGRALRPITVVLAFVLAAAWPLSGIVLPAAIVATLATGLAVAHDRRRPGAGPCVGWQAAVALGVTGLALSVAGLAGARTSDVHKPPSAARPAGEDTAAASIQPGGRAMPLHAPDTPAGKTGHTPASPDDAAPAAPGKTGHTPAAPDDAAPDKPSPAPSKPEDTARSAPKETGPGETGHAPAAPDDTGPDKPSPAPSKPEDAGRATPDESATEAPLTAAGPSSPDGAVKAYYAALDEGKFKDAWRSLSPSVQSTFGGYARWSAGFKTTVSSRPRHIKVESATAGAARIRLTLVATDRAPCGKTVERRFSVTWQLARAAGVWRATALHAAAIGPEEPSACA